RTEWHRGDDIFAHRFEPEDCFLDLFVVIEMFEDVEAEYDIELLFPDDVSKAEEPGKDDTDAEVDKDNTDAEKDENKSDESDAADESESEESKDAAAEEDKDKVEPISIDLDRIHLRAKSIVKMNADANSPVFAPNSEYLIFISNHEGANDWWSVTVDGSEYHNLGTALSKDYPQWSPDGSKLHFLENGTITFLTMAGSNSSGGGSVDTKNEMVLDQFVIWEQMMVDGWRYIRESFYDKNLHGVDWESVIKHYLPRVRDCGTVDEYSNLYRLMLAELNASHLSFYSIANDREAPPESTGDLGVIMDEKWDSPGWRVDRVIADSPADTPGSELYEGDVILKMNDHEISIDDNPAIILRNKVGIPLKLSVRNDNRFIDAIANNEKPELSGEPEFEERDVVIKPTSRAAMTGLLYEDWVQRNRETVYKKTDKKIGYQHIRVMYEQSLNKFRRELFTESMDKDALIIDVRFNSGGYIATDLIDILRREPAYHHRLRDGEMDQRPPLTWKGPIVVLINAHSFSNAEIFGHIMRDFGLATIMGESTGGGVISTYDFTLMDGSSFRIPAWLNARKNGDNMEHSGVIPDIYIHIDPEVVADGGDNQLDAAIDFLLNELKKSR
ncbi:MAG: S41 family peptidase, partial [bacterium]